MSLNISKNDLKGLVEEHFHEDLVKTEYDVFSINAVELLTHNRLDIAFKLLYLDSIKYKCDFFKLGYKEHIRAFSLGSYLEPGNKGKVGIDKFYDDFLNTFEDIKLKGFNSNSTLIPLSSNGTIANGAHRIASAIYCGTKVSCVNINVSDVVYDYNFFYERGVDCKFLDAAVTKFVETVDNIHIAFIWPVAEGKEKEIENIIPNIVYQKKISMNYNGAHNLISQIYYGEDWLGTIGDNFSGAKGKLFECFKGKNDVRVIAFQSESLDKVIKIKEKIRKLFSLGKHSIHISDTKDEAIRISRLVFNENSLHFLNNGKPNKYIETHNKIKKIECFIEKNKISKKCFLLDGGMTLAIYGLRKTRDIDYMLINNYLIEFADDEIEAHDSELVYHDEKKHEIVVSPIFHFYFNDIKYISFNQLLKMKESRASKKDKIDSEAMKNLVDNDRFKKIQIKIKQKCFYGKVKTKIFILNSLRFLKLYGFIKYIRDLLRGF